MTSHGSLPEGFEGFWYVLRVEFLRGEEELAQRCTHGSSVHAYIFSVFQACEVALPKSARVDGSAEHAVTGQRLTLSIPAMEASSPWAGPIHAEEKKTDNKDNSLKERERRADDKGKEGGEVQGQEGK